eukprot:2142294-Pyramimonas_sp.AAC.3
MVLKGCELEKVLTLATSAALVTSPWTTVSLGLSKGVPAFSPPEPGGMTTFEGVLHRQIAKNVGCDVRRGRPGCSI